MMKTIGECLFVSLPLLLLFASSINATIKDGGIWNILGTEGTDAHTGACQYETIAHDKFQITSLVISEVYEDIGVPQDAKDWFNALRPTIQTRAKKPLRKEYRQLTSDERSAVERAFWQLQTNYFGGKNAVEMFSLLHGENISPSSTRDGPAQLGWHREFLIRFEEALRRYEPDVALPYWDLTLETDLDTVSESVIWSSDLFGECKGDSNGFPLPVTNGPYGNWPTPTNCYFGNETLVRNCGFDYKYHGFNDIEMSLILDESYGSYTQWITEMSGCLTRDHDFVHAFISGNLHDCVVDCVVVDPISWALHGFIDLIWETYRSTVQTTDLETDYPSTEDLDNKYHKASERMRPFNGLYNIDGISTIYTDYFYGYKKPVAKCRTASDCGDNTDYVFCNSGNSRCMSKIMEGGNCTSYVHEDSCAVGSCGEVVANQCPYSSSSFAAAEKRVTTDSVNKCPVL